MSEPQATFLIIDEWLLNLKMSLSHDRVVPVSCHTAPTLTQMSFRGTPVLCSQGHGSSLGSCWHTRTLCISIVVTRRVLMLPNDTLRPLKSGLCWLIPTHNGRGLGEEWLGERGHTKELSKVVLHLKKGPHGVLGGSWTASPSTFHRQAEYPSAIHLLATLLFNDTLSWNHLCFL